MQGTLTVTRFRSGIKMYFIRICAYCSSLVHHAVLQRIVLTQAGASRLADSLTLSICCSRHKVLCNIARVSFVRPLLARTHTRTFADASFACMNSASLSPVTSLYFYAQASNGFLHLATLKNM